MSRRRRCPARRARVSHRPATRTLPSQLTRSHTTHSRTTQQLPRPRRPQQLRQKPRASVLRDIFLCGWQRATGTRPPAREAEVTPRAMEAPHRAPALSREPPQTSRDHPCKPEPGPRRPVPTGLQTTASLAGRTAPVLSSCVFVFEAETSC
jgi:hypothetical protein